MYQIGHLSSLPILSRCAASAILPRNPLRSLSLSCEQDLRFYCLSGEGAARECDGENYHRILRRKSLRSENGLILGGAFFSVFFKF